MNKTKKLDSAPPLPAIFSPLYAHLEEVLEGVVDQVMVRKYDPPRGLTPHIDNVELFGPVVCTLSLKADINMIFVNDDSRLSYETRLYEGEVLALGGQSRYAWKHGIRARQADLWDGETYPRRQRYSVSFRTVPHKKPAL